MILPAVLFHARLCAAPLYPDHPVMKNKLLEKVVLLLLAYRVIGSSSCSLCRR